MGTSQRGDGYRSSAVRLRLIVGILALLSACFLLFDSPQSSALTTVPTKMNFQGRLTDSTGNIKPNGTYNMKLRLYTVDSGGSAVWTEDRLVSSAQGVTITNGLFSIKLGDITTLPASLFASGELYLEVELPTPATATSSSPSWTEGAMTPRNQMATSAYAYNAETLDGLDSAAFAQLAQNNTFTGNTVFNGTLQGSSATFTGNLVANGGLDFVAYAPFARFSSNRIALGSNGNTYSGMDFTVRNDAGITSETSGFTYTRFGATNLGGNINTQRFNVFNAPSYTGAFTLTNAATVAIGGAATPSGGAVITNNYSLWTQGGTVRMDTGAAGTVGLVIRGAASQTADLLHLQNNGGTVIAKIDAAGVVHGSQLVSTVSTGTAPLTVASTTKVTNLNADSLDGIDSASFAQLDQNNTFTGDTVFDGTLQGGSSLTLGTASVAGNLVVSDGSSNTATISVGSLAGNYIYSIPVTTANDTFCLATLANCGDVYLANANTFTGANTFRNTSDSTSAFSIQTAASVSLFNVDTTNSRVGFGTDSPVTNVHIAANNSVVNQPMLLLEQQGSGDSSLELKDSSGKSFYVGLDRSIGSSFKISSSASLQSSANIGKQTTGGSAANGRDSAITVKKVTTGAQGGTLASISVYVTSVDGTNPGIKVALYSHDSGNNRPSSLVASTTTGQTLTTGWNTIPISATVTGSTTYWIAINAEGSSQFDYEYCAGCAGDSAYYSSQAYSNTWPSSLGAPTSTSVDENWSWYMTFTYGSVSDTFSGADLFKLTETGALTLQNSTNSSTAFQIQNAAGASVVSVNTVSGQVTIGTADTTGTLLVFDTKTDTGDPAGVAGGMYYNSAAGRMRCYEGSMWRNCTTGRIRTTADRSTTSTSYSDITDLSFAVEANTDYNFICRLVFQSAATTTGFAFSVNGPASPTFIEYTVGYQTVANATASTTLMTMRHDTAYNAMATTTSAIAASANLRATIEGTLSNGANAGTVSLRYLSEVNGSAITVKKGSYCNVY